MEIKFTTLHHVDHLGNEIRIIPISSHSEVLQIYAERLIQEIKDSRNKREFEFRSETTEVRQTLNSFLEDIFEEGVEVNSKRLLTEEKKAQRKIDHLDVQIQKGSLFQAHLIDGSEHYIVISKADHSKYIDEIDFVLKHGLPWDKKIFKAFLVRFDDNKEVQEVYVYDTTSKMSRYWWDDFLELNEKYTDSHNTKTSLDILDQKLFNYMKKQYPADHTILRNSVIGYFRNSSEFELEEFLDKNFRTYTPIDEDFPKEKYIKKIEEFPEKYNFDSRFSIKQEEIKKRKVNKIPLSNEMELILKDHIENIGSVIKPYKDNEGNKFILIRSDTGYERFKDQ
ncbi:nucleoid-associated protein [Marivirga sp.]|uniref:nucleoid-associated protein n=1 Tax=Marivirga sp. TaxID=2018662 RepID=UPI0025EA200B|nr:nucleoid-associated protein [Marivirga sp.]